MKITASRLSEGNKIFPAEIHVEPTGITIKIPGLFSGDSKYFDFQQIASVDVETPLIGYSTITIYAGGTKMSAHGFTKAEVKQVKAAIENGKQNISSSAGNSAPSQPQPKKGKDGIVARMLHVDDASMEHKRKLFERSPEERQQSKEKLAQGAKSLFKGIGKAMNSKEINAALETHNELVKITDDIDICLMQGKKDEAIELIKKLNHPSVHKLPDESATYAEFWANKRKEYISKLSS